MPTQKFYTPQTNLLLLLLFLNLKKLYLIYCRCFSKYEPVIGAGASSSAARELSPLSRSDASQHQQQGTGDTFALEHLVRLQSSTAAAALIPNQQVPVLTHYCMTYVIIYRQCRYPTGPDRNGLKVPPAPKRRWSAGVRRGDSGHEKSSFASFWLFLFTCHSLQDHQNHRNAPV